MPNIHDPFKDEDVNGVIIGGNYVCGKLEYDGRQQGGQLYAENHEKLKLLASLTRRNIERDLGFMFKEIYPDNSKWMLVYYA